MKHLVLLLALAAFVLSLVACGSNSNTSPAGTPGNGAPGGTSGGGTGGSGGSGSGSTTAAYGFVASGQTLQTVRVTSDGKAASVASTKLALNASRVTTNGTLVFVGEMGNVPLAPGVIEGFKINSDGSLTGVSTTAMSGVSYVAFDPSGQMLYAAAYIPQPGGWSAPGIYGFSVNPITGALTPLPGSPYNTQEGETIGPIAVSGPYVCADYGAGRASDLVYCFGRNLDGSISPSGGIQVMNTNGINDLAAAPDNSKLYGAGEQYNTVWIADLTHLGSPQTSVSSGGSYAVAVAVSQNKWLAVANANTNNIAMFNVSGSAPVSGPTINTQGRPLSVAFSKSGSYLFVSTDAGLEIYSVAANGALSAVAGSPVTGTKTAYVAGD